MSRTTRIELADSGVIFNPHDHTYDYRGDVCRYRRYVVLLGSRHVIPHSAFADLLS